jgi:hypothetical protein
MCGFTTLRSLEGVDLARETVVQGVVSAGGAPVGGAYVRLLDGDGEFTAEVVTTPLGEFRFFAAPGEWTLRVLSPQGSAQVTVTAQPGPPTQVDLTL